LSPSTNLKPPLFIEVPEPIQVSVMYLCIRGIGLSSFYDFSFGLWNCSDSVVFFVYVHFIPSLQLALGLWGLTPLLSILQLYHGGEIYWWRKVEYL